MGSCWSLCVALCRRETDRLRRGARSKYFCSSTVGEHYTIEFENLVESEEGEESPQPCPRPISEDELRHLREHQYTALSEKQLQVDLKLQQELEVQEERLRQEEEARHEAQRQAARLARQRHLEQSNLPRDRPGALNLDQRKESSSEDFDIHLQNVKAATEAFRSNYRLPSDPSLVTPNTEMSLDFTTKTRSTNEDGSLDLEWEDEEGMNRSLPPWERSRTEEDILRAALRPGSKPVSDESAALEWEEDFISSQDLDQDLDLDSDFEGFVNPVLDSSSALEELESHR